MCQCCILVLALTGRDRSTCYLTVPFPLAESTFSGILRVERMSYNPRIIASQVFGCSRAERRKVSLSKAMERLTKLANKQGQGNQ